MSRTNEYKTLKDQVLALRRSDFSEDDLTPAYRTVLVPLCTAIKEKLEPDEAVDLLLTIAEILDGCDLGSPGPIVWMLEKLPNFQAALFDRTAKNPTFYGIWMCNRLWNGGIDRLTCKKVLEQAVSNPSCPEKSREAAIHYLQYQTENERKNAVP